MRRRSAMLLVSAVLGAVLLATVAGVAWAASIQCDGAGDRDPDPRECAGTTRADEINGTDGEDKVFAREGNDILQGFGRDDRLHGEEGNDELFGGTKNDDLSGGTGDDTLDGGVYADVLIGGSGDDTLRGDDGLDVYRFVERWGKDTMIETDQVDYVSFVTTANLTINLTSDSGPTPEATDESGTNTVDWEGDIVNRVFEGGGDDTIRGNAASNDIYLSGGADTVYAGSGDDHIRDFDSRPDRNVEFDTIDCGPGEDSVYTVEESVDSVAPDCEHVT